MPRASTAEVLLDSHDQNHIDLPTWMTNRPKWMNKQETNHPKNQKRTCVCVCDCQKSRKWTPKNEQVTTLRLLVYLKVQTLPVQERDSRAELLRVEQNVHVAPGVVTVGIETPPSVFPAHTVLKKPRRQGEGEGERGVRYNPKRRNFLENAHALSTRL